MTRRSLMPLFGRSGRSMADADDPFHSLRKDMERLFEGFPRALGMAEPDENGFFSPEVDLLETDKGLELKADLPGISKDDIKLEIVDDMVMLKAEKRQEKEEKDEEKQYHLVERAHGSYMRRFRLPFAIDEDAVEARHDDGVLTVVLPRSKAAEAARKTIPIGD
jgi:HSP20 family protein